MAKLIVAFRSFAKATKKNEIAVDRNLYLMFNVEVLFSSTDSYSTYE
jgi:hypothetical protein